MTRDAESVVLEADYWKLVLESCGRLNDLISEAAERQGDICLTMVTAALDRGRAENDIEQAVSFTFSALKKMQDVLVEVIELADGRVAAIRAEWLPE